jgi:hypothetical protein
MVLLLDGALTLHDLRLLSLWRLLMAMLTLAPLRLLHLGRLLLESPLTFLLLPLLMLLPGLLWLTFLTVMAGFFLQSPPFSSTLHP